MSSSDELERVGVKNEPLDEEIEDLQDSLDAPHLVSRVKSSPSKEPPVEPSPSKEPPPVDNQRSSIVTRVSGRLVPLVCLHRLNESNRNKSESNSVSKAAPQNESSSTDTRTQLNGARSDSMLTSSSQMQDQAIGVNSDETRDTTDVTAAPHEDVNTLSNCDCLRRFPCLFCRKSYVTVSDLDRHSVANHFHQYFHDPPRYELITEEKLAARYDYLPITGDDDCRFANWTKRQLTRRTQFKCKFCPKRFMSGPSLNVHSITTHSHRFIPRCRVFERIHVPPSLLKTEIGTDADNLDSKTALPQFSKASRTVSASSSSSSSSDGNVAKIVGQVTENVGKVQNGSQHKRCSLALENENAGGCSSAKKKRRLRSRRISAPNLPLKQPIDPVAESSERRKKKKSMESSPSANPVGGLPPSASRDDAGRTQSQVRLLPLATVCATSPSVPVIQSLPSEVKAEDLASAVVFSPTASADAIIAALSVDRSDPFTADERESLRVGIDLQRAAVHAVRRAVRDIVTMAQVRDPGGPSALRFVLDFFNRL